MSPRTPLQHRREAERLLEMVWSKRSDGKRRYSHDLSMSMEILEKARVHAMLANDGYTIRETE